MFETCMVESAGQLRSSNAKWTTAGAFALEGTLLALVVVATMVQTDAIRLVKPPVFVPPYSAPRMTTELVPSSGTSSGGSNAFVQPTVIPREIGNGSGNPRILGGGGDDAAPVIPGSIGSGPMSDVLREGLRPQVRVDVQRIKVSVIDPSMLIHQVKPVYPPTAKAAGIQGTVEIHAIIGRDGSVQNPQIVSGHPYLTAAARNAVMQWRYKPTYLGGQPVEVETTITVNFILGGR
jgi:protein TonB